MHPHWIIPLTAASLATYSVSAPAQRLRAARTAVTRPITLSGRDTVSYASNQNWGKRTTLGTVGLVVGTYAGYSFARGYSAACDDPFCITNEQLAGAVIGGVLGAAAGAALPDFNSHCALTQRFLRGLAGSSLGLIGGAVLAVIPPAGFLVGYLFGPPIGASSAQGRCS